MSNAELGFCSANQQDSGTRPGVVKVGTGQCEHPFGPVHYVQVKAVLVSTQFQSSLIGRVLGLWGPLTNGCSRVADSVGTRP
jgi:hypothetical protein